MIVLRLRKGWMNYVEVPLGVARWAQADVALGCGSIARVSKHRGGHGGYMPFCG